MKQTLESKTKLLKSKLVMALGLADDGMSYDDAVRLACERLTHSRFNERYPNISGANTHNVASTSQTYRGDQPYQLEQEQESFEKQGKSPINIKNLVGYEMGSSARIQNIESLPSY
jgi:hypothetical protein